MSGERETDGLIQHEFVPHINTSLNYCVKRMDETPRGYRDCAEPRERHIQREESKPRDAAESTEDGWPRMPGEPFDPSKIPAEWEESKSEPEVNPGHCPICQKVGHGRPYHEKLQDITVPVSEEPSAEDFKKARKLLKQIDPYGDVEVDGDLGLIARALQAERLVERRRCVEIAHKWKRGGEWIADEIEKG